MEIYSPGGMFDGSLVQNLDTDRVASRRRNPIIADIFSHMHYNRAQRKRFYEKSRPIIIMQSILLLVWNPNSAPLRHPSL